MADGTLYLTTEFLKLVTNISDNVDIDIIRPNMIKAEDIYITPFLGIELDAQLKDHLKNQTTTALEDDLLVLIKKSSANYTAYLTYVDILFRWMNKSATTPAIENGTPISQSSLVYVRDITKNQAEFYLESARKFLYTNRNTFTSMRNFGEWSNARTFKYPFIMGNRECSCGYIPCRCGYNGSWDRYNCY